MMLVKKFEKQVAKNPGNIAVVSANKRFTYDDLNRYADYVAELVKQQCSGEIVGLLLSHGVDMIAAILGVLKTGKVYVPISADYPKSRIAYMLSDSGASLVLTDKANEEVADSLNIELEISHISIDTSLSPWENTGSSREAAEERYDSETDGTKIAYILYTSGSTGKPKGVYQTHINAEYYCRNWIRLFSITANDRMTLFSSFCHDGSVQDMFSALHTGATLYPVNMKNRETSIELSEFLIREKITIWHSVPSLFSYFANTLDGEKKFPQLRFILLGGEPVRRHEVNLLNRFFPHTRLANVYGQTESSVSAVCIIDNGTAYKKPMIGDPLDETEIFIIDEDGEPVEELESGEILVGSPYISPGYWKKPEITEKVFADDEEFGRLYWTGDLGRLLTDGSIEFLGRKDHQVKIRGFRVELGEIETTLMKYEGIKETVVSALEDETGDKYLVAYFVYDSSNGKEEIKALKSFLASELPDYMVPTFYIPLQEMPLTQSNKIDRKALPEPNAVDTGERYIAPSNEIEKILAEIWGEILGFKSEEISIDADFFQLGGHSLKATMLTSIIHKKLGTEVPLVQVFKAGTIRGLAEFISASTIVETFIDVEPVEKREYYPLSYNQKRLWVINQANPNDTSFNMPAAIPIKEEVDVESIRKCLKYIFQRHEIFRTTFRIPPGYDEPFQFILDKAEISLEVVDLSSQDEENTRLSIANILEREKYTPFNLSNPPFFRAVLIKEGYSNWHFVYNMHHIITDGWSQELLRRDFIRFYDLFKVKENMEDASGIEPLKLQYKDYSQWNKHRINDPQLKETVHHFWKERLKNNIPNFHVLYDCEDLDKDVSGSCFRTVLCEDIKLGLKKIAADNKTTLFVVMYAAFNWLLAQYSGSKDIVCSIISAGRNHIDLKEIVGFFVNSIVTWLKVDFEEDFGDFIKRTEKELLALFQHQYYPMELVLEELKLPYPDVSISFNMLNTREESGDMLLEDFSSTHMPNLWNVKFNLALHTLEFKNALETRWIYRTALFKPETIETIAGAYRKLLEVLVA